VNFSCVPIKLRLAIEIYFKNMIGHIGSRQEFLVGKRKGEICDFPLSIADLLKFFSNKKYKKYANLPVRIQTVMDINYWSNNLIHTGITSFAWQNLLAMDFLAPLFRVKHENGDYSLEGFNYRDLRYGQQDLGRDLSNSLSDTRKRVTVGLLRIEEMPIEGMFYF
jgi:hypothetical protein